MFLTYYLALPSSLQPQFPILVYVLPKRAPQFPIFKISVVLNLFLKVSFILVPYSSTAPLIKSTLKAEY